MLIEIVAHFLDGGKNYEPSAIPIDAPEAKARQWIKARWAIPVTVERAVIETPEAKSEVSKRETAVLKSKTEEKKQ